MADGHNSYQDSEWDMAATLINAGLLDRQKFLARAQRGEPFTSSIDESWGGRIRGDAARLAHDWTRIPETLSHLKQLITEHHVKFPLLLAKGMAQSFKQGATNPMEQPFQTVSDLLMFATVGLGGAGLAGKAGGAAMKVGGAGRVAGATRMAGRAAQAAGQAAGKLPSKYVLAGDVVSTLLDPADPIGLALLPFGAFSHRLTARRDRLNAKAQANAAERVAATPETPSPTPEQPLSPPDTSELQQLLVEAELAVTEQPQLASEIEAQVVRPTQAVLGVEGATQEGIDVATASLRMDLDNLVAGRAVDADIPTQQEPQVPASSAEGVGAEVPIPDVPGVDVPAFRTQLEDLLMRQDVVRSYIENADQMLKSPEAYLSRLPERFATQRTPEEVVGEMAEVRGWRDELNKESQRLSDATGQLRQKWFDFHLEQEGWPNLAYGSWRDLQADVQESFKGGKFNERQGELWRTYWLKNYGKPDTPTVSPEPVHMQAAGPQPGVDLPPPRSTPEPTPEAPEPESPVVVPKEEIEAPTTTPEPTVPTPEPYPGIPEPIASRLANYQGEPIGMVDVANLPSIKRGGGNIREAEATLNRLLEPHNLQIQRVEVGLSTPSPHHQVVQSTGEGPVRWVDEVLHWGVQVVGNDTPLRKAVVTQRYGDTLPGSPRQTPQPETLRFSHHVHGIDDYTVISREGDTVTLRGTDGTEFRMDNDTLSRQIEQYRITQQMQAGHQPEVGVEAQVPPIRNRSELASALANTFDVTRDEADLVADVVDTHAQAWAEIEGKATWDWYESRIRKIEGVGVSPTDATRRAAQVYFDEGRATITAYGKATVVSALHEFGHIFRRDLSELDLKIAEDWAGVKNGRWTRRTEERFAKAWERYLLDGQGPITIKPILQKLTDWLQKAYEIIKGKPRIQVSPEMRGVFDRLFIADAAKNADAPQILRHTLQNHLSGKVPTEGLKTLCHTLPKDKWASRYSRATKNLDYHYRDLFNEYTDNRLRQFMRGSLNEFQAAQTRLRANADEWGDKLIKTMEHLQQQAAHLEAEHYRRFRPYLTVGKQVELKKIMANEKVSKKQANRMYTDWWDAYAKEGDELFPEYMRNHYSALREEWFGFLEEMEPLLAAVDTFLKGRKLGGLKIYKMSTGESLPWKQGKIHRNERGGGYFPQMHDGKAIKLAEATANNIDERNRARAGFQSVFQAEQTEFGPFERMREEDAPGYEADPEKVIPRYLHGFFKRITETLYFGQRNEILNSVYLKGIYEHASGVKDTSIRDIRKVLLDVHQEYRGAREIKDPLQLEFSDPVIEGYRTAERQAAAQGNLANFEKLTELVDPSTSNAVLTAAADWEGTVVSGHRFDGLSDAQMRYLESNGYIRRATKDGKQAFEIRGKLIPQIMYWQSKAEQRLAHAKNFLVHHQHWRRQDPFLDDSKRFWRVVNAIPTVTLLGPSYVAFNLAEAGLIPMATGIKPWLKAARDFVTDPEAALYGKQIGAAWTDAVSHMVEGNPISYQWLNFIKGTASEAFVRSWAANAAYYTLEDAITKLLKNNNTKSAEADLKWMTIDPNRIREIQAKNNLTDQQLIDALPLVRTAVVEGGAQVRVPDVRVSPEGQMYASPDAVEVARFRFEEHPPWYADLAAEMNKGAFHTSQEVLKRYNATDLPTFIERERLHPIMRTVFKFKAWMLQHNRMMIRTFHYAGREAKAGNWTPAGRLLTAYGTMGLGGYATSVLMDLLYSRERDSEKARLLNGFLQVGAFGMGGELINIMTSSGGNPLMAERNIAAFIAGPAAGQAARAAAAGTQLLTEGDVGAVGEFALQSVPGVGKIIANRLPEPTQGAGGRYQRSYSR